MYQEDQEVQRDTFQERFENCCYQAPAHDSLSPQHSIMFQMSHTDVKCLYLYHLVLHVHMKYIKGLNKRES